MNIPVWLTVLAWVSLVTAFTCSAVILFDMFIRGYRQKMAVMEWVWPTTVLYSGPVGLYFYYKYGRQSSPKWKEVHKDEGGYGLIVSSAIGVGHCGAGCTLGDIIGANLVFVLGFEIAGLALWSEYIVDYALAFTIGIVFQYFAIAPMRGLGLKDGILAALKADTLSLTAFEVGMFGWMALAQLVLFPVSHLLPDTAAYWFLMQVAMIFGFLTAYPVNVWLIKRGIKEAM